MSRLKFLQFSDVHLGSKLSSSRLNLSPEKQRVRQRELRSVVEKACDLAQQEQVDIVLVPGDLWDDETISPDIAIETFEQFGKLKPVPVVITPGNHDFYSPSSNYNLQTLNRGRRERYELPSNIIIVQEQRFHPIELPTLPHVHLVGIAFSQNVEVTERLLRMPISKHKDKINILIFHGSLAQSEYGFRLESGKAMTLPFTRDELLQQGFDYASIGHYHHLSVIKDSLGRIRGAYAGCPAGRTVDEDGEKYVLVGEVEKGGVSPEAFRTVRLDGRRIWNIELNITGVQYSKAVEEKIIRALQEYAVDEKDIVYIHLTGVFPPGQTVEIDTKQFERYFHFQADASDVKPDYDIERLLSDEFEQRRTQGQFVKALYQQLEDAKQRGDEERATIIEQALYYGLDALHDKEVRLRESNED